MMTKPTIPPPTINQPRPVLTPEDLVEQLRPPTIWPAEWAIAKIEKTLRKRKEPGWSDDDIACLGTAVRLCADREEAIPLGLQKRFKRSCGKLAIHIMRNQDDTAWIEFAETIRGILPVVEATCVVLIITKRIAARFAPDGAQKLSAEDAQVIVEAQDGVRKFSDAMPERVLKDFHATLALAGIRSEQMLESRVERIRDVEAAIPVMAALTDSGATPDSPAELQLKIQHLHQVFNQFGIVWHPRKALPESVLTRFECAAHAFATAVVERRGPHWSELQRALHIEVDPGYVCGGMRVPPLEELPWP